MEFAPWAKGEPNNWGDKENCAQVLPNKEMTWNDNHCESKASFVCEHLPTNLEAAPASACPACASALKEAGEALLAKADELCDDDTM